MLAVAVPVTLLLVMALTRIIAAVNAAVVVIPVLAIHLVTVEFDPAVANAKIQAVVLPPVVLFVIPVEIDLDAITGDLDAIATLAGGAAKAMPCAMSRESSRAPRWIMGLCLVWVIARVLLSLLATLRIGRDLVGFRWLVAVLFIFQIEFDRLAVGRRGFAAPQIEAVVLGPAELRVIPVQIECKLIDGEFGATDLLILLCRCGVAGNQKKGE